MEESTEESTEKTIEESVAAEEREAKRVVRREVAADLIEGVPDNGAVSQWILASPLLLFLAWLWIDVFAHYSPIPFYWLDAFISLVIYALFFVLPLGVGVFYLVTSLPRLFSHAGWDVQPLEAVSDAEIYMVRYRYQRRHRAATNWRQAWLRAAQGWVYLEMATILIGGVAIIPLFFSVSEFGFGQ